MAYPNYNDNWRNGVNTDYAGQFHNWSQNYLNNSWNNVSLAGNNSTSQTSGSGDSQSWASSLFGGGQGNYSAQNIMGGISTITQFDQQAAQLTDLLAGQNTSKVGTIMKTIPGFSAIGGLVNAAFGSHINSAFVDATNRQINAMNNYTSNATTNDSLLADFGNFMELSHVKKSEVGSDGWFSHKARNKTNALNASIDQANIKGYKSLLNISNNVDSNNDLIIAGNYAAFGGPIGVGANSYDWGGAVNIAQGYIKSHEGWRSKPYSDTGGTATIGWGFTNSGFRSRYKEGITNHYKRGMTQEQAQQELNWYLRNASKELEKLYGQYNLTDAQKAAILDTYYQRPASVSKNSRFYKALKAGDKNAVQYLGVSGYGSRNSARQALYSGNVASPRSNEYTAPVDNTRVAKPVIDFNIPRSKAFDGIKVEAKQLPVVSSGFTNSPSFGDYLASITTKPQTQQQVSTPQYNTVEQIMQNYDNFFNSLGDTNFFADGGGFGQTMGNIQGAMGQAQGWMGIAGTTINTIKNWGKEDPTLGRNSGTGAYGVASQMGMATYDIIKGIRDATKSKRESPMEKLGLYANGGHLFDDGGGMGAMGYANIGNSVLKLASNVKAQASIDNTDDVERGISNFSRSLDEAVAQANTNDDILNLFQNRTSIDGRLSGRDLRDKSYFDDFLSSVPASFEGFNAGSSFGPWGAAIGAVVGGASSVIGSLVGRHKANKKADELNEKIERANKRIDANLDYAVDRVDEQNDLRALQNYVAMGGSLKNRFPGGDPFGFGSDPGLSGEVGFMTRPYADGGQMSTHGADFTNGLTFINEGGRHGENPNGGVPMGTDREGTPNLVEEGETVWNGDYVFSDRLKVPKSLREKYHLPEGITYAEASKKLSKESLERTNDPISKRTLNVALGELSDMQELKRAERQEREASKQAEQEALLNSDDVIASLGGSQPFAHGGRLGHIFDTGGVPYNYYKDGLADSDPINWGFTVGKNGVASDYTPEYLALVNKLTADDARAWAKEHPDDPSLQDYLKRGNKLEDLTTERWRAGAQDGKYGFMHRVAQQMATETPATKDEVPFYLDPNSAGVNTQESYVPWQNPDGTPIYTDDEQTPVDSGTTGTKKGNPSKGNYKDTYMRYAPIVGSFAMALNNLLNDPDYSNPNAIIRAAEVAGRPVSIPVDVIGDYRTRKPFDERYLTNLINQNNAAAIRSSLDIAGGNRAMGLSAILANNAVNEAKLAEAARQAYLANRADDMQVSEFNRGTNMFNAQANNQRNSAQAQLNSNRQATMLNGLARGYMMRQALDDQRSAAFSQNLTNALQGLGDIGWENSQRNWLQSLADRGVLKGMFNSDGKQDFAGISNPSSGASSNSNGGKLKTKKRRF